MLTVCNLHSRNMLNFRLEMLIKGKKSLNLDVRTVLSMLV